ncbi:unnamed protein product [Caenorhabditis auriculariae]|uniref:Mitochondrial import receptor subunit TOM22 homolog n=1 Tax=Caenorhabditis auriculariae TaxID=2777116 RepID=A0A8S1HF30_9PELO|nr:unnamed protein product [Caenorhabditis auriculariae]
MYRVPCVQKLYRAVKFRISASNNSGGSSVMDEFDTIPDGDLQESAWERIQGLSEMFPKPVRKMVTSGCEWGIWSAAGLLNLTRNGVWVLATTSLIAFLPYIIEKERSDLEKTQVAQQRQMLLGPTAAIQSAKESK